MGNCCMSIEVIDSIIRDLDRDAFRAQQLTSIAEGIDRLENEENPPSISMDEFQQIGLLGHGSFGEVVEVMRNNDPQERYAMKKFNKLPYSLWNDMKAVFSECVNRESMIHYALKDCDFIATLHCTCKDNKYYCFVLSLTTRGTLRSVIRSFQMPTIHAVFYAAQIVLALEYMHTVGVVHHDLKPENILVGEDGYIQLADFGLADRIGTQRRETGTVNYLSPEAIRDELYTTSIDWWALGIITYEMICGVTPYNHTHLESMLEDQLTRRYEYPRHLQVLGSTRYFIDDLLEIDIDKRLGCGNMGAQEVKDHAVFLHVDWMALYTKKYRPPMLPERVNADPLEDDMSDYPATDPIPDI